MRTASIVVLALLLGWFARGIGWSSPEPQPEKTFAPSPAEKAAIEVEPQSAIEPLRQPPQLLGSRNLFAYREPPPRIEPPPVVVLPPPVTHPPAPIPEPVIAPPETPFPYRFIGTIGPRESPIAVFKGSAEIVLARPNEAIGNAFVLRAIGLESVEIESTADGSLRRIIASNPV